MGSNAPTMAARHGLRSEPDWRHTPAWEEYYRPAAHSLRQTGERIRAPITEIPGLKWMLESEALSASAGLQKSVRRSTLTASESSNRRMTAVHGGKPIPALPRILGLGGLQAYGRRC